MDGARGARRSDGGRRHDGVPSGIRLLRLAMLVLLGLLTAYSLLGPDGYAPLRDFWLFSAVLGLACVLAAARPILVAQGRVAWSLLAAGMVLWTCGDTVWQLVIRPMEDPTSPQVSDPLYLALYPCAIASVIMLAPVSLRRLRANLLLDAVVAGLGIAALAALAFDRIAANAVGTRISVATNLAYPIFDLVLLGLTLAVLALQGWRLSPSGWLVGLGCVLLVVADTAYLLQQASDTYVQGSLYDIAWPAAFSMLAAAGWSQIWIPRPSRPATLPVLAVPAGVSVAAVAILLAGTRQRLPVLAVSLAAIALLAAAARTVLSVRELQELAGSRELALTDELTGLGNRRRLRRHLDALLDGRRPGDQLAVLLLDLDRFKEVNDALGHHAGDELLRQVGPRLAGTLRESDLVVRLGGDEFALVIGPGADATHAVDVARRVRLVLRQPFAVEDVVLHVDVSVGIALCPDHAVTRATLLQRADVAMYEAKRRRSGIATYRPESDRHDRDRLQRIDQLHAAVAGEAFVCHYQPQADLRTGAIVGVEALVRWEHPTLGLLTPDDFLPLTEEIGLMAPLTRRVLDLALRDSGSWRRRGIGWTVSVNVSGSSLADEALPGDVARLLARHHVPASCLVLEITEGVMAADPTRSTDVLDQLGTLGVRLSIDDYGTGYSSMTQLRTVAAHELKLDRSYIRGLGSDPRDAAIVRSTVDLAHALGLLVVAEGVETADDWHALAELGCDRAQGYHLSPPMPLEQLLRLAVRRPASMP